MRKTRRGLFLAEVFLSSTLAIILWSCRLAWAQGQPITFSVTADIPYGTGEISTFQDQITDHNKYSPSVLFMHLGDILSGSESCKEERYALVATELKRLAVPAFIVPGDNETNDCKDPVQGFNYWQQYFSDFEQNFCGPPVVEHQNVRHENLAFTMNGVLFAGLNIVAGRIDDEDDWNARLQDGADWVDYQFNAKVSQVRAAVVFAHAGPASDRALFFDQFVQSAAAFNKPVLYIHGSDHSWIQDNPWSTWNTMRVIVNNGGAEDPVEVTVTMNTSSPNTAFTFNRQPWNDDPPVYNMPPCVNAGLNQVITFPQSAALDARASDDGDPDPPGAITAAWSKASGPGTATFGDANALSTTANFSAPGTYVLRLTVDDGGLQKSDDVTITVAMESPIISSFSPTTGTAGTEVTIIGDYFLGVIGVTIDGVPASFTVDSATQLRAIVPAGATTGKIEVVNSAGSGLSLDDFIVQHALTINSFGNGSVSLNPLGGTYDAGTVVTLTATPAPGHQFSSWSGDLSGTNNPETITMDADKNVTAIFSQVLVDITHEETQTGVSSSSLTVTTAAGLTSEESHLYLAVISSRPRVGVASVTGLGLTWTLVKSKCAGRNTTGIQVWKAQGTPVANEVVTATFVSAPNSAVISVSRYSGVATSNPIGNVIAGNTNGLNGAGTCSGGVNSNAYAFDLATTVNQALVFSAVAIKGQKHTPGAGYTERVEVKQANGSFITGAAVEDQLIATAGTTTVNGSFGTAVDWAMVALEIKPLNVTPFTLTVNSIGSGAVALNPPGGIYSSGTVVTLTPQSGAGFQFNGWSDDLSGSANPATITMNGNKTVTATFIPSDGAAHQETETGGSSNSTIIKTSTLVSGVIDHLYLVAISTRPRVKVASVYGLGLTWTMLKSKCAGRNSTWIEVWWAQGEPSSDDTVRANLVSAATNAVIAVSRYSGVDVVDPIGNVLAGNTNGVNGGGTCYGGVNTDSYSFDLATTTNGSVVYGAAAMKAQTHTAGAGYTERAEIKQAGSNLNTSLAVEDQRVDSIAAVTVNGSFSNAVDWAVVGVEIKPQSSLGKHRAFENDINLAAAPLEYHLEQNFPNPFNAQTRIQYSLPEAASVRLVIYNIHGQRVRTLVDAQRPAGRRQAFWNGTDDLDQAVGSGVYLLRLDAGSHRMTRRILLVK